MASTLEAAHHAWAEIVFQISDATRPAGRRNMLSLLARAPPGMNDYPDFAPAAPDCWAKLERYLCDTIGVPAGKRLELHVKGARGALVCVLHDKHSMTLLYSLLIREGADTLRQLRQVNVEVHLREELHDRAHVRAHVIDIDLSAAGVSEATLSARLKEMLNASNGLAASLLLVVGNLD